MKNLVAFVGFKSSGKNTAALPLLPYDYVAFSFADSIKDALSSIFCWDRDMIEGITPESRAWREEIDTWWADKLGIPNFSPRWAMMNFGTELMRKQFNENIWLYNVERRIMTIDKSVVLVDCRFANEIAMARQLGGKIVRIKREHDPHWMWIAEKANAGDAMAVSTLEGLGIHQSEYDWIGTRVDATIENNGSIANLHGKVLETCLLEGI